MWLRLREGERAGPERLLCAGLQEARAVTLIPGGCGVGWPVATGTNWTAATAPAPGVPGAPAPPLLRMIRWLPPLNSAGAWRTLLYCDSSRCSWSILGGE